MSTASPASSPSLSPTNACINELKTRARLGLNAIEAGDSHLLERAAKVSGVRMATPDSWKLRHAFTLVARSVGFRTWDQARIALGGQAQVGDDMGTFWHAPRCLGILNHWFAHYGDARDALGKMPGHALVPYRRQFIVVNQAYLHELGLGEAMADHVNEPLDLVALYGSARWQALCWSRLRADESTWFR
ncbi:MAG: hypothetical protein QM749_03495 [Aquabacterium sp.]